MVWPSTAEEPYAPSMSGSRVVFIGAVHEALPAMEAVVAHPSAELVCVVTLPDEMLAQQSGHVDLSAPAQKLGVGLIRTANANSAESLNAIRAYEPDLIVAVGWTRLLSAQLLEIPVHGCVGFHASLLPQGRGRAPVNWAIIHGESLTGNTMMLLDAGVDTGRIVDQRSTAIYVDDTCGTVYGRLAQLGADMLRENLTSLLAGEARAVPQDPQAGTELPKRTPKMGIIDWKTSPLEVHNWVRALTQPYPGAYTMLNGRKITVWATAVPEATGHMSGAPGEVLQSGSEGIVVGAAGGSVLLTEVDGHHELSVGDRFDVCHPDVAAWARGGPSSPRVEADLP